MTENKNNNTWIYVIIGILMFFTMIKNCNRDDSGQPYTSDDPEVNVMRVQ